jgi:nucleoside-diphosphate-sugar epimerase
MKCLVTGAAGFIGSHLCERLLGAGHSVTGVDAFIPYYPRSMKESNLAPILPRPSFSFHECDLRNAALAELVAGTEVIFHVAAMAGLTKSWTDFELYETCNLLATQRLVEAARRSAGLRRFIYASTSSVYGRMSSGDETIPTRPISPYGVTKLAAENLCRAYAEEHGLPVVVLRYFSVYGPRQRPDMGYYRFIQALLNDEPVTVYGDGMQIRGNTYVDDCVAATLAAVEAPTGETYNVGGGETATVWQILEKLEALIGRRANVRQEPARPGDQRSTSADTSKLRRHLGWHPRATLDAGLARQVEWQRQQGSGIGGQGSQGSGVRGQGSGKNH